MVIHESSVYFLGSHLYLFSCCRTTTTMRKWVVDLLTRRSRRRSVNICLEIIIYLHPLVAGQVGWLAGWCTQRVGKWEALLRSRLINTALPFHSCCRRPCRLEPVRTEKFCWQNSLSIRRHFFPTSTSLSPQCVRHILPTGLYCAQDDCTRRGWRRRSAAKKASKQRRLVCLRINIMRLQNR